MFCPAAFTARFGYAELGCTTVTPGVVEVSTPETEKAVLTELFRKLTNTSTHSFGSTTPLPLPVEPSTANAETNESPGKSYDSRTPCVVELSGEVAPAPRPRLANAVQSSL